MLIGEVPYPLVFAGSMLVVIEQSVYKVTINGRGKNFAVFQSVYRSSSPK